MRWVKLRLALKLSFQMCVSLCVHVRVGACVHLLQGQTVPPGDVSPSSLLSCNITSLPPCISFHLPPFSSPSPQLSPPLLLCLHPHFFYLPVLFLWLPIEVEGRRWWHCELKGRSERERKRERGHLAKENPPAASADWKHCLTPSSFPFSPLHFSSFHLTFNPPPLTFCSTQFLCVVLMVLVERIGGEAEKIILKLTLVVIYDMHVHTHTQSFCWRAAELLQQM